MKKLLIGAAAALLLFGACTHKHAVKFQYPTHHGQITYFQEKEGLYSTFSISRKDIVMVGDDVFDRGMWNVFYGSDLVKNRGIALEGTECTMYRIGDIASCKPAKIFISTGLYDLKTGESVQETAKRIVEIAQLAQDISPRTAVYVLGIVPDLASKQIPSVSVADSAATVNSYLSKTFGEQYIDVAASLCDSTGYINRYYMFGGNRINGAGYEVLAKFLAPYVGFQAQNTIFNDPVMVSVDASSSSSVTEHYYNSYSENYAGRSAHYLARLSIFNSLPNSLDETVMLGNSITNNCWWEELLGVSYKEVINRGISGDVTSGIMDRLYDVLDENPSKIYIMTGVNDFIEDAHAPVDSVWANYREIISTIRSSRPRTLLFVMSTLPLNPKSPYHEGRNAKVMELDSIISANAPVFGYTYIDLASLLEDENGNLDAEYTSDGIHLLPKAYHIWKERLKL